MADHMAWHEGQHIKIQKSYDAKLTKLMAGHRCSSVNAIDKKWKKSLKAAQHKFDAKDALWPYPEYTGPGGYFGTSARPRRDSRGAQDDEAPGSPGASWFDWISGTSGRPNAR